MFVPILLGSEVDKEHAGKIVAELDKFGIPSEVIVASAHKVPEKVISIIEKYNASDDQIVYVTIAGRSNGLSGVTAGSAVHPVIACPPFSDKSDYLVNIHSTLQMPKDTPVLTVLEPQNCALTIARIFGLSNPDVKKKMQEHIAKVKKSFY